jgi:3-hydroxyisobutyrate dehydrogenase-like beta-hydroxyacid dehydrogenase
MTGIETVGFIGTGAMGEHMCRHIAAKSGKRGITFNPSPAPLDRLAAHGVTAAASAADLAAEADMVLLSLPGGPEVEALSEAVLLPAARPGWVVCDTSTTPVATTRALAPRFAERGAVLLDCPVARTQKAAVDGTLAIMVGGPAETLERVRDVLACMGPDVSHCGSSGCGQIAKILNNMVLFETGLAVAEALTIARRAGMDGKLLLEILSSGSADSFALRNHGLGSMVPGDFPQGRFPTRYALKDLSYALMLADDAGVDAKAAKLAAERLEAAVERGDGERYWPVAIEAMVPDES